jgi:DNA polymerase III epsilon subunit-like protein
MTDLYLDVESTGLYAIVHRVICIGAMRGGKLEYFIDRDEKRMLEDFLAYLSAEDTLVGFNIGFDYGFIVLRCLKHKLDPSRLIARPRVDLMDIVVRLLNGSRVSLQTLADFFRITYNPASGKVAPEMWESGDLDAIRHHCLSDIMLTAELHERLLSLLNEPATAKQLQYLHDLGIPVKEGLTKSEASKILDEARRR